MTNPDQKSHVGMGYHLCPVCFTKHDEVVLLDTRLRNTLTREMFVGLKMCPEHQKLWDDNFIALIEVNGQPKDFLSANRTGEVAHIRVEAFKHFFNQPAPNTGVIFVEPGVIQKIADQISLNSKDPT